MPENKYKQLITNTAIFALGNLLSKVVLAFLLPLYTHKLTAAEYGIAELVTTISQLIVPILSLAIEDAVFRFSMEKSNAESVLKNAFSVIAFSSGGLFITSLLLRFYSPMEDWIVYFFLISVLSLTRSVISLYTKAIGKTVCFTIDNIIFNTSLALFNIVLLVFFDEKINGYFLSIILACGVSIAFLVSRNQLLKVLRKAIFDIKLLKIMLIYSAPLILNSISWGLTHVVDKIMLTKMCSSDATGIYSAASKIPSLLSLVTGVFTQAWSLSAIQDYEHEQDKSFYSKIFSLTHIGVIMCALVILAANNQVIAWVLGKDFKESIRYVPVLLLGTVFLTYSNYFTPLFAAMKNSKLIMWSALSGSVINCVLNAILIPQMGIMGACIATTISYMFIAVFRFYFCQKKLSIKIDYARFVFSVILIMLISVLVIFNYYAELVSLVGLIIISFVYWKEVKQIYGLAETKIKSIFISKQKGD